MIRDINAIYQYLTDIFILSATPAEASFAPPSALSAYPSTSHGTADLLPGDVLDTTSARSMQHQFEKLQPFEFDSSNGPQRPVQTIDKPRAVALATAGPVSVPNFHTFGAVVPGPFVPVASHEIRDVSHISAVSLIPSRNLSAPAALAAPSASQFTAVPPADLSGQFSVCSLRIY